jgi:molybdopterin-guanine dinucleotide biosynthesis protein A
MGHPKAWLAFDSEPMLCRVVRLVSHVLDPIVVVAAPEQTLPPLAENVRLATDEERGRGPLQGLLAGMKALKGDADAAYLSSCDVPFLKAAFIERMVRLLGEHSIAVAKVGEHYHPLAAVYRLEIVDVVGNLLKENRLRPFFLFDAVPTRVVEAGELADVDPSFSSLRNLNTPEDYQAALRELEGDG